jgi:uncharacterized membrane protein HdeD (DUF308 family)
MRTRVLIGVLLIVFGVFALAYQGISYTQHKKVLDLGSVQATKKTEKEIPLPPVVGVAALAGGILLLVVTSRPS